MDDQYFKERMAWRSIYERRFCPPDDVLFGPEMSEQLESHLEFCEFCTERLEMDITERKAWQELDNRMKDEFPLKQFNTSPSPGQVWSLQQDMLGGWGQDNRFYTVPQVLLLESIYEGKVFKAAQLFSSDDLATEGDIILPDGAGFAESWNTYLLHRKHLKACLASLGDIVTRKAVQRSAQLATQPNNYIIEDFRQLEHEFAKELSARAAILVSAEHPKPEAGMFVGLARLLTPIRIAALAAMVVAVISISILKNTREPSIQTAQAPSTAPYVSLQKPSPTKEASQDEPLKPATTAKPPAPVFSPTLTASADAVMKSKTITAVTTVNQQQFGFTTDQIEHDRAAFLIGIAFADLTIAIREADTAAYDNAVSKLKKLTPAISNNSTISMPSLNADKSALSKLASELEQITIKSGHLIDLQFGTWLQVARIADDTQLTKIIDRETLKHFSTNISPQPIKPSLASAFDRLSAALVSKNMDLKKVRRLLDEIYSNL